MEHDISLLDHAFESEPTRFHYLPLPNSKGRIYLRPTDIVGERGVVKWDSWFTELTLQDLIPITEEKLKGEWRFNNSLRVPWSVHSHAEVLRAFLHRLNGGRDTREHELYAVKHDSAEAYTRDIPTPFKTDVEREKEDAVFKAFGWPTISYEARMVAKRWDYIAAVAEALKFGWPQWTWPHRERERQQKAVDLYSDFLDTYIQTPEFRTASWTQRVWDLTDGGRDMRPDIRPLNDSV